MDDNPWLRPAPATLGAAPGAVALAEADTAAERIEPPAPTGAPSPQPFVPAGPGPAHPHCDRPGPPGLWWMGVHGGAGESTLADLSGAGRAAEHAWPRAGIGQHCVVLVSRTHYHGLTRVRRAAAEWARGDAYVHLLGLALVADAPGRPPKPLRDLADHVAGGVPRVWRIPWVESWRMAAPELRTAPRVVHHMLAETAALASAVS